MTKKCKHKKARVDEKSQMLVCGKCGKTWTAAEAAQELQLIATREALRQGLPSQYDLDDPANWGY